MSVVSCRVCVRVCVCVCVLPVLVSCVDRPMWMAATSAGDAGAPCGYSTLPGAVVLTFRCPWSWFSVIRCWRLSLHFISFHFISFLSRFTARALPLAATCDTSLSLSSPLFLPSRY
jgi:hypothetical protein